MPSPLLPSPSTPAVKVTLAAVAKQAGLSASAASAFVNGKLYTAGGKPAVGLSETAQFRLIEAMRVMGYEPANPELRLRVYPELGDYCYVLDSAVAEGIANPYHSRIFSGIVSALATRGRHAIVFHADSAVDYLDNPEKLPAAITRRQATRFITAGKPNYSFLTTLRQLGLRAVHVSRSVNLEGVSSVVPDYAAAAEIAIRHLHSLGHGNIGIVAAAYMSPEAYNTRTLLAGVSRAFADLGLPYAPDDVVFSRDPLAEPFDAWLALEARPVRPTAVFCLDDFTALQLMRAATRRGLVIPRDLSVVGCNDETRSYNAGAALTTVHFPLIEIGERAVALLDEPLQPARTETLPVHLVRRESCAAPASTS